MRPSPKTIVPMQKKRVQQNDIIKTNLKTGDKQCRTISVSLVCINVRKATVSSSHHTDLMFSSANIFHLVSGAEALVDV